MDPNANLNEQRRLAESIHSGELTEAEQADAAERLADLVEALDQWIVNGGFLPSEWARASEGR